MNQNIVDWNKIYRRVTENRDTGKLIEDVRIDPRNEPKEYEYNICKNPLEDVRQPRHDLLLQRAELREARRCRDLLAPQDNSRGKQERAQRRIRARPHGQEERRKGVGLLEEKHER